MNDVLRNGAERSARAGMKIVERAVYRGPHLYSATPMIRIQIDLGALERAPSNTIPDFNTRLLDALPGLSKHGCCYKKPGGFVRRLQDGTWLGHVIEHAALELQNEAGFAVTRGKTRSVRGRTGVYNVMFEYLDEAVGLRAGRLAAELVASLLPDGQNRIAGLGRIVRHEPAADLAASRRDFLRFASRRRLGPTTSALVDAARRRGIPVQRMDEQSLIRFGWGRAQQTMRASISGKTSHIAVETAGDKHLTRTLLQGAGLPAPRGALVRDAAEAIEAAERLGFPVAVKPLNANHGRAVSTNLQDADAVAKAFAAAQELSGRVIVETFLAGRDYRVLVIGGEIAAVAERMPAAIMGDGVRTIEDLIVEKNADPRRGKGHANVMTRIEIDPALLGALDRAGLSLRSVPGANQRVVLRAAANLSSGGEAIDRTDDIHPENAAIARRAAALIGLDIAGVDIVCPDIARPMRSTGGGIVEINAAPGYRMHLAPSQGRARDVAKPTLRYLFPKGEGRIPVIAITGTNGKSTTARMTAHILRQTGARIGLACTSGVYIDDQLIWKGDASGPQSARMVLADAHVDVAVLETARGGILREGLAFDRCDVGAVLNVSEDHLGVKGIDTIADLAAVKSIVTEAVGRTGVSVLNADDPLTRAMARHAGGRPAFFSMKGDAEIDANLRAHIDKGGLAALCDPRGGRETLALYIDGQRKPIMRASELPASFSGAAQFNIQNALAAALIAHAQGVPIKTIRLALQTFTSSYEQNPGRMNIHDEHGFRVIMDYAHNPAALKALVDTVRRLAPKYNRCLATVSTPGDRRDEDILEMGRIAARGFDFVIFRERPDTRGRAEGAVVNLLAEGARQGGMTDGDFTLIAAEEDATKACLEHARPGDLVVLMPTDVENTWSQIEHHLPPACAPVRFQAAEEAHA
jgi:cyanophycin synthetase